MNYTKTCYENERNHNAYVFTITAAIKFQDVEKLGMQLGFTFGGRNFHNVSLGQSQGQEPIAEEAIEF